MVSTNRARWSSDNEKLLIELHAKGMIWNEISQNFLDGTDTVSGYIIINSSLS